MSGSNAELVASWFAPSPGTAWDEAMARRLYDEVWDPEIEWQAIAGAPDDVGLMQGRDRLWRYYTEWLELFEDLRHTVLAAQDVGDRAVLTMRVSGRARSTGMPLELTYAVVCEVRDGRLARGHEFQTLDEALAAARADLPQSSQVSRTVR